MAENVITFYLFSGRGSNFETPYIYNYYKKNFTLIKILSNNNNYYRIIDI